jgi:hypothetical protein
LQKRPGRHHERSSESATESIIQIAKRLADATSAGRCRLRDLRIAPHIVGGHDIVGDEQLKLRVELLADT